MARSGAGIYSVPVGTDGVTDTTIESAKYNTFIHDVETDLNAPRPIVAGGTGASNAHDAMVALGGMLSQQDVTNYDAQAWQDGSFNSQIGATGAPIDGHRFVGIALVADNNPAFVTLMARDLDDGTTPGILWVRRKRNGVWDNWLRDDQAVIDLANTKVAKTGDAMTGDLSINRNGADTAALYFGTGSSNYLYWAGGQFYLNGGPVSVVSPINPQHAATKQYADTKLPLSGGGLTGPLTLDNGTSASPRLSLASSGFASWGIDTASGFFRIYSDAVGVTLEFDTNGRPRFGASPQVPEPDTNSSAATVNYVNNKFANVSGYLPLTGGTLSGPVTVNGGMSVNQSAGSVDSGGFGSFIVQGPNDAYVTFHRTGVYAVNFGLSADGNFWYGGISAGTGTRWRFWTTKDFTALPASGTRLLFAADTTPTAGHDPYPGAVMASLATNNTLRYRYVQTFNGSTWVTVALA